ncbi:MAG TPA: hypothetical protein VFP84_28360 [Kofleriaceae bacterium]|nr:hypothetical protein [Kofleriaceae bacterium]
MTARRATIAIAAWAAGCSTPVPSLNLELNQDGGQVCPSKDCTEIKLPCPTVLHIQIFDPNHPGKKFIDQCAPVLHDDTDDICQLASVDLASAPIPVERVKVQTALFLASDLTQNPDGSYSCPDTQFSADGFPAPSAETSLDTATAAPIVGGVGWYEPGDNLVNVVLGCTNLAGATACQSKNLYTFSAPVLEFPSTQLVIAGTFDASRLELSVGEPHTSNGQTLFDADELKRIGVQSGDGTPAVWGGQVDLPLERFACVHVLDQATAAATGTVSCVNKAKGATTISLRGTWIDREPLDAIAKALGLRSLDPGLTIGVVLDDDSGKPAPGRIVSAPGGTITYLTPSADGMSYTASDAPTVGSTLFASIDAPFPTEFSYTSPLTKATQLQVGGKIAGKVTVVTFETRKGE